MKKILYTLLIASLALAIISCGGSDDSTKTLDSTAESLSGSGVFIVAGLSGNILRSTNKGSSFDNTTSPTSMSLYGVAFGNSPKMSAKVVEMCRAVTTKPLITKLSPNQTNIADCANVCIDAGTDAFSVPNTFTAMAIDIESKRPVLRNNHGGLSGPAIKPMALLKVFEVYQVSKRFGIPIVGQGGIVSSTDAIEFLLAGASAIGVGTGLFYDPSICKEINAGIIEYMDRQGVGKISEITGSLELYDDSNAT